MNPLFAQRRLAPEVRSRYASSAAQRERILWRLLKGPATREELELLGVPSATKRISELRRVGHHIDGEAVTVVTADGHVSLTVRYALAEVETKRQLSLL